MKATLMTRADLAILLGKGDDLTSGYVPINVTSEFLLVENETVLDGTVVCLKVEGTNSWRFVKRYDKKVDLHDIFNPEDMLPVNSSLSWT